MHFDKIRQLEWVFSLKMSEISIENKNLIKNLVFDRNFRDSKSFELKLNSILKFKMHNGLKEFLLSQAISLERPPLFFRE